ncbi:MAG: outer membrane protein assembly factor BamD [Alphaproteobacteria bacterium]
MKLRFMLLSLGCGLWAAGCSSISLPSLPSMPSLSWSSSTNKPDPTAEALFDEGMRYFKDKRYARAIDNFSKIKTDYPFSPLLTKTELQLADAYYLNQQYPEAINAFKEFESMHPSNENLPFVVYRLGQSYFDQFTATDRDQKNTEIAKGYFEGVLAKYPKSPYAADAREKLAKCNGYLAEHNFNIAQFYLQQGKYPAARDRFEEIVRRYRGTPAAAKSLFFLGESYRKEGNNVKASLAYEALIQHYPDNSFAAQAQSQLAQIEKQKQDPLAMLLMRDHRPSIAVAQENGAPKAAKVDNLVAKTEVVYEEPGAEKNMFQRVVDKINPFSSSSGDNKATAAQKKSSDDTIEQLAQRKAAERKQESSGAVASSGFWSSLNPFASNESPPNKSTDKATSGQLVQRIDDSLQAKGIDSKVQTAALTPPAADLPKPEEPPPPSDTTALLGQIDSGLKKDGKSADAVPATPESGDIIKNMAAAQARIAKANADPQPAQSVAETGLLSAIDQKLQSNGVATGKMAEPPVASAVNTQVAARKPEPAQKVELEPKVNLESGPLFLSPAEVPAQASTSSQEPTGQQKKDGDNSQNPEPRQIPQALVKGPSQPAPTPVAKKTDKNASPTFGDEEDKGVLESLKQDAETLSKILNPFSW